MTSRARSVVGAAAAEPLPAGSPPLFAVDLPGAAVRFSTRAGGVSEGPFDSLNLGIQTGDDSERVVENRRLLAGATGLAPELVAIGHQVHGAEIARWDGPPAASFADATAQRPEVDGHVTDRRSLGLAVQVADCLPVALADGERVAMVHCGWRGVAAGIVGRAVEELGADPGSPAAAVGPGIGRCCFEVGPEVLAELGDVDAAAAPRRREESSRPQPGGGWMLDLRAVVEARLRAAGVARVEHIDLCTSCREDLFFSHRRDRGSTGRQCGIAWRT